MVLGIAVGSKVESNTKLTLNSKKIREQKPKFKGKKWALIVDNRVWNIMLLKNYIKSNFY